MACCSKICIKQYRICLKDIFNNEFNFYTIPQEISEIYKDIKIINFVNEEELKNIVNYISYRWENEIKKLISYFANFYYTYDPDYLTSRIYNFVYSLWDDSFIDIFLEFKILDPNLFVDKISDVTINSSSEEDNRRPIRSVHDFRKENVKTQDSTATRNKKSNIGDSYLKIIENRNSALGNLFDSIWSYIDSILKRKENL